ncbi:MAG TPA: efflux RND transporter periplasmic adaptor subunit [Deltaproteobacteria bacterium]|nr:efflux RND transporter periplasmic adaptor subunit [Deltaproteobacteria bacterium]HPR55038.1 efflux RND transporter periplasmic adaptor subunit [Deltaproteobacteria bacterium]HXK48175.1 efflux RND transporter periplasmic adaptor subunit [Deltaproteobacteria bacterium]
MDKTMNPGDDIGKTLGVDNAPGPRRLPVRKILWGVIAAVVIAGVVLWISQDKGQSYTYETQDASRGDLTVTVSATGNLEPINQVDVGSELSGIVRAVEADYNDHVKKGQILARLDTDKLDAQVQQSRANLRAAQSKVLQAQATLAESRSALERLNKVKELSGGKVPSKNDLDTAEATYERAQADLASAEAEVKVAEAALKADETDLSKAVVRSPINGIVLTRSVEPGQTVAASLQAPVLFTLAEDLKQMELQVDVDEADVGSAKEGQQASFTVDAYPDRTFKAKVIQVRYGAKTTDNVVTYTAVLLVNNADLLLRPGMTATADIVVKKVADALMVPNAALRFSPPQTEADTNESSSGGSVLMKLFPHPRRDNQNRRQNGADKHNQKVWTLKDGKPVAIPITTGSTNGAMTEVVKGDVAPGTVLIVDAVESKKG